MSLPSLVHSFLLFIHPILLSIHFILPSIYLCTTITTILFRLCSFQFVFPFLCKCSCSSPLQFSLHVHPPPVCPCNSIHHVFAVILISQHSFLLSSSFLCFLFLFLQALSSLLFFLFSDIHNYVLCFNHLRLIIRSFILFYVHIYVFLISSFHC